MENRDVGGDGTGREGVFSTAGRVGLATNCVSCCSCMVRAARVVLMLFSEMCCFSVVTLYKRLGKISDILHLNNENNQLERRARPSKDVSLDVQS